MPNDIDKRFVQIVDKREILTRSVVIIARFCRRIAEDFSTVVAVNPEMTQFNEILENAIIHCVDFITVQ